MKKNILTLFIAAITTVSVNAQAVFGVKGGVNFASIMGSTPAGVNFRTGYNFGVVAEMATSSNTAVQAEVLYSSQGFDYDGYGIIGEIKNSVNFSLDYINIPLVFKYYINDGFSFEAGPQVGFVVSDDSDEMNGVSSDDITNASFDYLVGFGYKFDNGLNVNARYIGGVTNIWKYNDFYDYYGKRNSVFQLTVGYYFN